MVSVARRNVREEYRKALALTEIKDFAHLKRLCKKFGDNEISKTTVEKTNKSELAPRRAFQFQKWPEKRVNEVEVKQSTSVNEGAQSDSSVENPHEVLYVESIPKNKNKPKFV